MPVITRTRFTKEVAPALEKAREDARRHAAENVTLAKTHRWFCGHATARIVNIRHRTHTCEECTQSHGWEFFYKDGQLRTGT
jgi:hypothetical protein